MKNISKILALALGVATIASCDLNKTPVWSDDNAFAAFDRSSVSVAEDDGKVSLPVSIASVDPVEVSVTYVVVDSLGTATAGTNFTLANNDGVLRFDGEQRTAYIDVNIIDLDGQFTGDLTFTLQLTGAGDLKIGSNNTCTVTITDKDHPLSDILGWYTCVDNVRPVTWQMEIRKDESDLKTVWFYNIGGMSASWAGDDIMYYGTVDYDSATGEGTITVPLGQTSEYLYSGTTPVTLYSIDADQEYIYSSGSYVMTIKDYGKTIEYEKDYGLYLNINGAGWVGWCGNGTVATKN